MHIMTRRKWTKWAPASVAGAALGLALLLVAPADAAPAQFRHPHAADPLPPPPQIRSLYRMLGSYKCEDQSSAGASSEALYVTNTKGLGGHYFDSYVEIRPNVLRGQSVIGWDPVDGKYINFYEDDWGSSGTATAPGWNNGHLVFSGSTLQVLSPSPTGNAPGIRLNGESDYQIIGSGHYTDTSTTFLPNGQSVQHSYDCRRL